MTITASGRSALILATGLWIGFAGPLFATGDAIASSKPDSTAATSDNSAKHGARHSKKYAHSKSDKPSEKSAADAKAPDVTADEGDHSPTVPSSQTMPSSQMPTAVANANAELTSADTPAASAKAMSDRVNNILQAAPNNSADAQPDADTTVVAADQLNDVDRALHQATPPATPIALASAEAPAAAPNPPAAASSDNSTWDQTSLIGKIFIGFGALLTMASAARMFMA